MADKGTKYTDKKIKKLEKNLDEIYYEAYIDISKKLNSFTDKYIVKEDIYQKKVDKGEITQEQFDKWKKGQVFQGKQWKAKKEQVMQSMYKTNEIASHIISNNSFSVFAENANYMSYDLEHTAGLNFGFGLYDSSTVAKLVKDDPQLLPEWKIDEPKDYVWNQKKLNRALTHGIIQGEKLEDIAKRIANSLVMQNKNASLTFARTAMTGAQNSGRDTTLMNAKGKGIKVIKEWMATLDGRTRDTHRAVDGEKIQVGDKWHPMKFSNGCRFPGDPQAPPHEVYNCRCTLVGDLVDYPAEYERYDNIDGKPIKNMSYADWYKAKYSKEIKPVSHAPKPLSKAAQYKKAQKELETIEQEIKDLGADKEFTGIWKDNVTYADWEEKKDSIQGKKEYYNNQIQKYKKEFYDQIVPDDESGEELYELISKHQFKGELVNDSKLMSFLKNIDLDESDIDDLWDVYTGAQKKILNVNKFVEQLDEFEKNGQKFYELLLRREAFKTQVASLAPKPKVGAGFNASAYTKARKDAAVWAQSPREADKILRAKSGEVWRNSSEEEKDSIYDYTRSYHKFNEPLRGIEYGTNRFLGVGNTDLNAGSARNGNQLNKMTDIIDKSWYNHDTWLQRGCHFDGMDKFFNCDMDLLMHGTQEELENKLLGTTPTEYGFMSCGSAKGNGFSGDILLNVYAPSGTKMMYVEPFSAYGLGSGRRWDGIKTQNDFGDELETILQQGTQFRITKVERKGSKVFFDLEVIDQSKRQRWK